MNEQQMNQLKSLPFPIFCYFGGDDLSVSKVEVDHSLPEMSTYVITYTNGLGGEIKVYGCNGGVGDIPKGDHQVSFSSFLYGSGTAEVYPANSEEKVDWRTQWLDSWRKGSFYGFSGKGLGENYIKKIAEGLVELE